MSVAAQAEQLLQDLRRHGVELAPGLPAPSILDALAEAGINVDTSLPDDYLEWWNSHNGALRSESVVLSAFTPSKCCLHSITDVLAGLQAVLTELEPDMRTELFDRPTLPLFFDLSASLYALRQSTETDRWELWFKDRDKLEWSAIPHQPGNNGHPTLLEWLTALNEAIDQDQLIINTRHGRHVAQIVSVDSASSAGDVPSSTDQHYPWK